MNRRDFSRSALAGMAGLALPAARTQSGGNTRSYRYVRLDVFTDRPLAGNQLLVFPQPAGLDADTMLALTRESNYSSDRVPPGCASPTTKPHSCANRSCRE